MSQRNPMNDRYTTDGKKGQTRKSAAKAKPKTKAASSVHVQKTELTKKEKKSVQKAAQKAERSKDTALEREAYAVPTAEYKRLRRIWFAILGVGVVLLGIALFVQFQFPEMTNVSIAIIVLAYAAVIGAFIFDKVKINKLRKAYKEELRDTKSKEARAQAKAFKAEETKVKEEPVNEPAPAGGMLSGVFKWFGKTPATDKPAEQTQDSKNEEAETKA